MGPRLSLTPEQRSITIATVLLNAMASMCSIVLFLSAPYIGTSLGLSQQEQLWPADAFLIAMICVPLFSGKLAERIGYRKFLIGCIGGTCIASILCGLAPGVTTLTLLSAILGTFSGPITPTTQAMIVGRFPSESRGTAMSLWGAGTTAGVLLGGLASGLLIEHFSWRLAFAACIPLGLLALPVLVRIRENRPAAASTSIDRTGFALLCLAILSFGVVINLGDNYHWFDSPLIVSLASLCVVALVLFVRHYRRTPNPVISFAPLRQRQFAIVLMLSLGIGMFTTGQFQTDMLGGPLDISPELLSLRSILGGIAMTIGVLLGGPVLRKLPSATVILVSLCIALCGKAGCLLFAPGITTFDFVWPQIMSGFALGFISPGLAVVAFDGMDRQRAGDASGIFVLGGRMGSALGIAMLSVVFKHLMSLNGPVSATATPAIGTFITLFVIELIGFALLLPTALLLIRERRKKQENGADSGRIAHAAAYGE